MSEEHNIAVVKEYIELTFNEKFEEIRKLYAEDVTFWGADYFLEGKDQIISFSKPFDFVSLLSIFSSDSYMYSVTAVENTIVCILDLNVVKRHAQQNAMFTMDLMTHISEATDKIILENLEIKRKHLKGRVAHVLLYFAKHIYNRDEFELPVSRREIAEYIGMSTENVIRTLSEFRKDKIIKIFGKAIEIIDKSGLKQISDLG